jgi:hypothetical protein
MVGDDLFDYAKTVTSREDFVKFAEYLNHDYHQRSDDWGNKTLEQFLSGLSGFANDMAGYYKNMAKRLMSNASHGVWQQRCFWQRLCMSVNLLSHPSKGRFCVPCFIGFTAPSRSTQYPS